MSTLPLLEVEDLRTLFHTDGAVAHAVDGISFTVSAGEILAIVGESGSGKSVTSLSIMRLVPTPPGEIAGGRVRFRGRDLLLLSEPDMRRIRGNEIGMIFQEPMSSLNPLTACRQPSVRWHAPTCDDRNGVGLPPSIADRRRTYNRVGRNDPGADPPSDPCAAGGHEHERAFHHPQSRLTELEIELAGGANSLATSCTGDNLIDTKSRALIRPSSELSCAMISGGNWASISFRSQQSVCYKYLYLLGYQLGVTSWTA